MLLHVKQVLNADELREARVVLKRATWGDGRVAAGVQSAQAKNNEQLSQDSAEAKALRRIVLGGLNRHAVFFSAALPKLHAVPRRAGRVRRWRAGGRRHLRFAASKRAACCSTWTRI